MAQRAKSIAHPQISQITQRTWGRGQIGKSMAQRAWTAPPLELQPKRQGNLLFLLNKDSFLKHE